MSVTERPISAALLKPLARESDVRLVELSREGDEQAFEALVRRHRHELHVYAARLMGAEGRAEDALQHALMSAWVVLRDRGVEVANPRAWLYGIVHNSAVSVLRRARHDTVELNDALEAPHPQAGPETHVIVGEIFAGLAQMPAPQRHALLMTAVAGSSHGEAASALGVSAGAVRGMVYRARAALRQAAAAVLPPGLINWATGVGHRRPRLPVDPTDAAAATSASAGVATSASAGVAAAVVKGGAIIAAVGALAGATGPAPLPKVPRRPHHRPAAAHHSAPTRHGSSGLPRTLVLSPGMSAHQPGVRPHHALTAIGGGGAEHSHGQGRGQGQGQSSPGQGPRHGDRSGSSSSSGRGPGDNGSSNGDSSNGDSSGSGHDVTGSSGSGHGDTGASGSGHGDTGNPTAAAGSSAIPSATSSGSSAGSGPGPSGADQSSGDGGPAASLTTSPADGSGGGDASGHGGGADGGRSGSGR